MIALRATIVRQVMILVQAMIADLLEVVTEGVLAINNMKLSFLSVLVATALFSISCGSDGFNQLKCLENVELEFPTGEIRMIPNEKFRFLAKDSNGSIWYVVTLGSGPEVSGKVKIFD